MGKKVEHGAYPQTGEITVKNFALLVLFFSRTAGDSRRGRQEQPHQIPRLDGDTTSPRQDGYRISSDSNSTEPVF